MYVFYHIFILSLYKIIPDLRLLFGHSNFGSHLKVSNVLYKFRATPRKFIILLFILCKGRSYMSVHPRFLYVFIYIVFCSILVVYTYSQVSDPSK